MKKRKGFNRLVTMIAVVAILLSSVIFPVDATGTKASAETSSDEDAASGSSAGTPKPANEDDDTDISDHKNGWFALHRLVSVITSRKGGPHKVYFWNYPG